MNKWLFALALCCYLAGAAFCQTLERSEIFEYTTQHWPTAISEYRDFLTIPNNGRIADHRRLNAAWCLGRFQELGFETQELQSEGIEHVFASKVTDPKSPTILFYLQIDGQPVDSTEWFQASPYEPVLKQKNGNRWDIVDWSILEEAFDPELRVFARSASDSKGPAMSFISALQILQDRKLAVPYNLKVIMDFQEELSSPTLSPLVKQNAELFAADMMIILDGTRHVSNLPTLAFGGRGIATITLRVFGASRDLHSGQYGNFAPNPVFKLTRLISGMKDEDGRVTLPGFYEGVNITAKDRAIFARVPEDNEELETSLGIAEREKLGASLQEALQYPSLNVRGIRAAWVGNEVRTIIPAEAIAEIDIRTVPETEAQRQVNIVRDYILAQGYHFVDSVPTTEERKQYPKLISFNYRLGSRPFRAEMDSELGAWLEQSMQRLFDDQYVMLKINGGSQPISPFINTLDIPAVSVRIPNPDNSIHAPNENLRLGNFMEGIQSCLSILTQPIP